MLFVVGVFQTFRMHSSVCLLCALIILPFDGLSAHVVVCIWVRCFLISSLTPLCMCSVVILPSLSVIRMPAVKGSSFSMVFMSWGSCL